MFKSLFDRFREPSTYAGLAGIAFGVGQVVDFNESEQVAGALTQAGEVVAQTGDPVMGGVALVGGLLAIFMGERGRR